MGLVVIEAFNEEVPAGEVTGPPPGRYVRFRVTDNGPGIPMEHRARLFDPYFTTKKNGSGLGLATSHSIVKRHGGQITFQTELGRGTTFDVLLPAASPTTPEILAAEPSMIQGHGRVLMMDDNESLLLFVARVLGRCGYDVEVARDAAACETAFDTALRDGRRFDAVILDLTLPGGPGGLDVLPRLRARDALVPIIATTGYVEIETGAALEERGFAATLPKPFKTQDLTRILHSLLESKRRPSGTAAERENHVAGAGERDQRRAPA